MSIRNCFLKKTKQKHKNKTCSPIETVVEVKFCCKAAFRLVQNYGVLAMFHQQIHVQISFTHEHFYIFFLCKGSELRCKMGIFLQKNENT